MKIQTKKIMGQLGYEEGDIGWLQLNTGDPEKGIQFYTDLFGWKQHEGPMPDYHMFGKGEEMLGGITGFPEGCDHPAWIPYVTVKDIDATITKVIELGGKILVGPNDIPGGGKIVVFADPTGAPSGAAQYAKKD